MPRYRQIADDLRQRLASGEFPIGTKLPPISDLQEEYACQNNHNMIRHAQSVLIDEGLIEPRQGQGTFVIALPTPQDEQVALAEAAAELKSVLDSAQVALTRFMTRLNRAGASAWPSSLHVRGDGRGR